MRNATLTNCYKTNIYTYELLPPPVPEFLPWGVVAFWPISGKIPKLRFKFWTLLHANAMFFDSELLCYIGITIRIQWMLL